MLRRAATTVIRVRTRLKDIVIDARHPAALARFWATVLGYHVRPYEQDDLAFLASIGRTPDSDPAVAIDPPDGVTGPSVCSSTRCRRRRP